MGALAQERGRAGARPGVEERQTPKEMDLLNTSDLGVGFGAGGSPAPFPLPASPLFLVYLLATGVA